MTDYLAELRRLTAHCEFGDHLSEALRDRLVCGLRSEATQKRLLTEPDLTLDRALELAQGMEAASHNAKCLQNPETAIKALRKPEPTKSRRRLAQPVSAKLPPCHRCGRTNHLPADCKFLNATCHNCHKQGI